MKDNFSTQSEQYAQYRPNYPSALFDFLNANIKHTHQAWDCGTGNGQVAYALAKNFDKVFATDISPQQIAQALQAENIVYSVQAAEKTCFEKEMFDLIVVAQAIHWFDFEKFYAEVRRSAKAEALLCVVGYGRLQISPAIDALIDDFYYNVLGAYWDVERRYIDENYQSIPFPFAEIQVPAFVNVQHWNLTHLMGYLSTWSAVKHFIKKNNFDPTEKLKKALSILWGEASSTKPITFPILCRLGKIHD